MLPRLRALHVAPIWNKSAFQPPALSQHLSRKDIFPSISAIATKVVAPADQVKSSAFLFTVIDQSFSVISSHPCIYEVHASHLEAKMRYSAASPNLIARGQTSLTVAIMAIRNPCPVLGFTFSYYTTVCKPRRHKSFSPYKRSMQTNWNSRWCIGTSRHRRLGPRARLARLQSRAGHGQRSWRPSSCSRCRGTKS